jgi:hypothetical protein
LRELAAAGHSAALTIDADMQHPPAEGLRLARAAAADPALWLGVRDMERAPRASRTGRWWTSLWTWVACGMWPQDNQTGLRVYPLPVMSQLSIPAGRYAFEIESLVKAAWRRVPIRQLAVAVSYPADRISHFRAWIDSLRTARAFARLVARRCVPWPYHGFDGWPPVCSAGHGPGRLAAAGALGAAMGVAPVPGLQTALTRWLATRLRLDAEVALQAANISFGPLLAGWIGLELIVGQALRSTGAINALILHHHPTAAAGAWPMSVSWLGDWLVGSIPVMVLCAAAVGTATWLGASRSRQVR